MGYQKKGAEPLTEAEMHTLLESMLRSCSSMTNRENVYV